MTSLMENITVSKTGRRADRVGSWQKLSKSDGKNHYASKIEDKIFENMCCTLCRRKIELFNIKPHDSTKFMYDKNL